MSNTVCLFLELVVACDDWRFHRCRQSPFDLLLAIRFLLFFQLDSRPFSWIQKFVCLGVRFLTDYRRTTLCFTCKGSPEGFKRPETLETRSWRVFKSLGALKWFPWTLVHRQYQVFREALIPGKCQIRHFPQKSGHSSSQWWFTTIAQPKSLAWTKVAGNRSRRPPFDPRTSKIDSTDKITYRKVPVMMYSWLGNLGEPPPETHIPM